MLCQILTFRGLAYLTYRLTELFDRLTYNYNKVGFYLCTSSKSSDSISYQC